MANKKSLAKTIPCSTNREGDYCKNKVSGPKAHCASCRSRKCRKLDAVRHVWNNLRVNSKRRSHSCTITLEEFREFIAAELLKGNDYMALRGVNPGDLTLDRDKDELGYAKGNIQIMRNEENLRKRHSRWHSKTHESAGQPTETMPGPHVGIETSVMPDF